MNIDLQGWLRPRYGLILIVLGAFVGGYGMRGRFAASPDPSAPAEAAEMAASEDGEPAEGESSEEEPPQVQWWTCSMHPQIRQPEPGKCPICAMDLIPVTESTAEGGFSARRLTMSREAARLADIQTAPVERRFAAATVRLVGRVTYDETRVKTITAWVPGRLDRLYVDYTGTVVETGNHMVSVYSPKLLAAQEELLQALQARQELSDSAVQIMRRTAGGTVDSAGEKLRLWGLTEEQIRDVERRGEPRDHLTIYAPMGGTVIKKHRDEGEYVETGSPIYTIADLSHLWVKLDAYESDMEWIRYGQQVEFTTEAYPGETFEGRISFIDPHVDERTRTVNVRVNVANPQGKLKPGMFLHGVVHSRVAAGGRVVAPELAGKWISPMHPEIVKSEPGTCDVCGMDLVRAESLGYAAVGQSTSEKPLVIPTSAALVTGKRAVVYVKDPDSPTPAFEGREIVLGPRAGDYYIVRRGLTENESVVTNGNFKIDSSLQIQAKPSMMNPLGAVAGSAGGHDHGTAGGGKTQKAEEKEGGHLRYRARAIVRAAKAVEDVLRGEDLPAVRAAFGQVGEKVDAVPAESLDTETAKVWKEFEMLIGNDAFQGARVETQEEAEEAFELLEEHVAALGARLGLHGAEVERFDAPTAFRRRLKQVWSAYVDLHAALAEDDAEAAAEAAATALGAIEAVKPEGLEADARQRWAETAEKLTESFSNVSEAPDTTQLRAAFAALTPVLQNALRAFGPQVEEPIYRLSCAMALDGRGAGWLQHGREVRNPYFGQSMLGCGEVVDRVVEPSAEPVEPRTAELRTGPPAGAAAAPGLVSAPDAFRRQLVEVWNAYRSVHSALAADDAATTRTKLSDIRAALKAADMNLLNETSHRAWMEQMQDIREAIGRMEEAEDLSGLRRAFPFLTETVGCSVAAFGLSPGRTVYRLECPMAFDGEGGTWLQESREVVNPYFGTAMQRCGEVVDTILNAPSDSSS